MEIVPVNKSNARDYIAVNSLAWLESYQGIVSREYLININTKENLEEDAKKLENNLLDGSKRFLLKVNDEYVGLMRVRECKYEDYSEYGELGALYLLNCVKGKGYGKILFELAKKEIVKMGYKKMLIGCLVGNPYNSFYEHMGAVMINRKPLTLPNKDVLEENIYEYIL